MAHEGVDLHDRRRIERCAYVCSSRAARGGRGMARRSGAFMCPACVCGGTRRIALMTSRFACLDSSTRSRRSAPSEWSPIATRPSVRIPWPPICMGWVSTRYGPPSRQLHGRSVWHCTQVSSWPPSQASTGSPGGTAATGQQSAKPRAKRTHKRGLQEWQVMGQWGKWDRRWHRVKGYANLASKVSCTLTKKKGPPMAIPSAV